MLEIRTMWHADFTYPQDGVECVEVLYDTEKKEVQYYKSEGDTDFFDPSEDNRFFFTQKEAENALEKYCQSLLDKMAEVKKYLEVMGNFRVKKDNKYYHEKKEYMPNYMAESLENSYYQKRYEKEAKENEYLRMYIRTGYLNVYGYSFRIDEIKRIVWGEDKATIELKDGAMISTSSQAEFEAVNVIAGCNVSDKTW